MPRRMSEALKEQLAESLGIAQIVRTEGWGAVPARDCGRLVKEAIRRAEELLASGQRPLRFR